MENVGKNEKPLPDIIRNVVFFRFNRYMISKTTRKSVGILINIYNVKLGF